MRAGWPAFSRGASTSSIGALTYAGRRGRGDLADLAGDFRHDAGERRGEGGALESGERHADLRLRALDVGGERIAAGLAGARFGTRVLGALRADESLCGELLGAVGVAPRVGGEDAGLAAPFLAGGELARRQFALRGEVAVPQLQQRLPGLDALAFLHPQLHDLAAQHRGELGAAAGLDGAGAGVDHGRFDRAAFDGAELDFGRLRPGEMPARVGQRGAGQDGESEAEPGFILGHGKRRRRSVVPM
jgi:hypothetical protein